VKTCAAVIQSLRQREPEAFALKTIHWQLFCVLTFRSAVPFESSRKKLLVSWLREFEKQLPGVDYRRILIVSRFELGKRGRRGHLHLCIAGLPQDLILGGLLPRSAARWWRQLGGGIACVRVYDSSRDGLEYVLKRPVAVHTHTLIDRPDRPVRFDELVPTLSDSVLKTMRRSRHVRDGASRT
jgi:hypothetical protein